MSAANCWRSVMAFWNWAAEAGLVMSMAPLGPTAGYAVSARFRSMRTFRAASDRQVAASNSLPAGVVALFAVPGKPTGAPLGVAGRPVTKVGVSVYAVLASVGS